MFQKSSIANALNKVEQTVGEQIPVLKRGLLGFARSVGEHAKSAGAHAVKHLPDKQAVGAFVSELASGNLPEVELLVTGVVNRISPGAGVVLTAAKATARKMGKPGAK